LLLILSQPYPYYNTTEKIPKNAVVIFLFVSLFLYLFSPFGVNEKEHKYSYIIICIIHALNAAVVYFIFFFLFNRFTKPSATDERWKVYNTIIVTAAVFLLIGFGSFLIRPLIYTNPDNFSWHYFVAEIINTFLTGTLIFAGFTLVDYHRLLKINRDNAANFEKHLKINQAAIEDVKVTEETPAVNIVLENENYELNLTEFLFAKAEGNYVTFYFNKNDNIIKQLKRASLKNAEEQLSIHSSFLVKTHRAFLVNTKHIIKMTGNAQGYQLFFENIDFAVPVSRAMIPGFKLVMND
jgi:hypothetical protein